MTLWAVLNWYETSPFSMKERDLEVIQNNYDDEIKKMK
jgi:hypothetical protein